MSSAHDNMVLVDGEERLLASAFTCTKPDLSAGEGGRPVVPDVLDGLSETYWKNSPLSTRAAFRSPRDDGPRVLNLGGSRQLVHLVNQEGGVLVNLDPGKRIETIIESETVRGHRMVKEAGGAVIRHVPPRSAVASALLVLHLPTEYGDDAEALEAINTGKHAEALVYRLLSFFMELRLQVHPKSARIRAGNAAACYWNMMKMVKDGDPLSVQTAHGLRNWIGVQDHGTHGPAPVVVYTGPSTRRLGMTLLTRLCAVGGPVQGLRSPCSNREVTQRPSEARSSRH